MSIETLPLFLHDATVRAIFVDVVACVTDEVNAYLVSGGVRNALVYKLLGETHPARDYDIVVTHGKDSFVENLLHKRFVATDSHLKKPEDGIILRKPKVASPDTMQDYVYLDIIFSPIPVMLDNLAAHANFTLNGAALPLQYVFAADWFAKVIVLPTTIADIQHKRICVNDPTHPAIIFACLRFMSLGFAPPPAAEVEAMLQSLSNIDTHKLERNIQKLTDYVGGLDRARELARTLGVRKDIFVF